MKKTSEILYGVHPVTEALRAGRRDVLALYLAKKHDAGRVAALVETADARNFPVRDIPAEKLMSLTGSALHQGVALEVTPFPYRDASLLDERIEPLAVPPFWVMIDCLADPGNLGAIIRTAVCAGARGIVLPKDRSAPASPAVSKASAGALEHATVIRVTNLVAAIHRLKETGFWIAGLDASGGHTLFGADLTGPIGLVVGGEEKGVRPLVKKTCDFLLSIPQEGPVDSLNASVAGAIAIYEIRRQRQPSGRNP